MALLHTGDRICASCGGINGRHRAACSGDESIDVLNVYTRRQAIDDGILVDCEQAPIVEMRRQLMKWPLAMTATAFHRYVWPIDEGANLPPGQSLEGRFWDVVWMFHAAVKGTVPARALTRATCCSTSTASLLIRHCGQTRGSTRLPFSGAQGMRLVTLKAVSGPGDDGEPVMTFMLLEED